MSRIVRLSAENVKRLRAVTITPTGNMTVVGGNNGQGKSSVLDSIEMALGGKKSIPPRPIRDGESSARIVLELDDLTVTRRFTEKDSYLEVTTKEGTKFPSAQAVLDQLYNNLSFDPVAFTRLKPAEQAATLRAVCGIDTASLDKEFKEVFEERTAVNRDVRSAQAAIDAMPKHDGVPTEPVSVADMLTRVDQQTKARNLFRDQVDLERDWKEEVAKQAGEVADLEERLAQKKQTLAEAQNRLSRLTKEADEARVGLEVADVNIARLRQQIATAEETNQKARENAARAKQEEVLCAAREQSDALTARLDEIAARKQMLLQTAEYPVDGLSISEDGAVLFRGIPFEQASSAEQIRVSAAIGIAMNPKLPVLLIRDGSLLDESSMRMLSEFAEQHGAQVWIERVGAGEGTSVVIHDGAVVTP